MKTGKEQKKELIRQYKEIKPQAGIFQIRNLQNQKVFLKVCPNLKSVTRHRFQLERGMHFNKALQAEWDRYGEAAFVFETLEILDEKTLEALGSSLALKQLEERWLKKLEPYGEKGYHKPGRERGHLAP